MPKIRRSVKRLHYEDWKDWKDWQKEAYLGVHTKWDFSPILDAHGYQYQPIPVYGNVKSYMAFDMSAPQVERWISDEKEPKRTLVQRFRDWLNK